MKKINFKELGKAFLIILLYLVIIPELIGLVLFPFFTNIKDDLLLTTLVNLAVYVIDVGVLFFIYRKSLLLEWKSFLKNFKSYIRIAFKNWGKGFLVMVCVNLILVSIVGNIAGNEQENRKLLEQLPVFSIFAMVILGPIMEEIAFRKGFKHVFEKKEVFLFFTAILFGLMHVIGTLDFSSLSAFFQNWKQILYLIPYSALGYYFGKAYYDTDCIFTSISCHMLHNGLSVFLIFLAQLLPV